MESFNHVHYGYGFSWRLSVVGVYQGMEMNRANDLLERALKAYECNDHVGLTDLMEFEIRDFLSTPEPTQDEGWQLREVYFHADGEPGMHREPAQRPEFVRLSEDEVTEILTSAYDMYEAICAVENRLVKKNSINRSDPDSIDLQSRCRGDKP